MSTDMNEDDMVFGGMQKLTDTVTAILREKPRPRAIVIISSCPAGIIGDDIDMAKSLAEPGIPVITIKTDGNLSGDYLQGMLMCYTELARQIIDPNVQPEPNTVNIVFEKVVAKNTENNFHIIRDYLDKMGIRVNCRFLCNTYYDELKNFRSASLNLLAHKDYTGKNFTTQPPPITRHCARWNLIRLIIPNCGILGSPGFPAPISTNGIMYMAAGIN
ncbi:MULTISPECIES: nitrogenase component 1 [Lachnospiraceae]|uniref:nitrogenase component 1 n=1 Tax=Lachnospiraceae TaxID=186803 RepID=UPI0023EAD0FD|nr:nitrogenase component 1 [Faecalicatena contorta]